MKKLLITTIFLVVSRFSYSFEEFDDRYPTYSVPIYPNESVIYINTNHPSQSIKDLRSTNVLCTTNKSRYFSGENIRVSIDIFYREYAVKETSIKISDEYSSYSSHLKPNIIEISKNLVRYFVEIEAPEVKESTTFIISVMVDTDGGKIKSNVPVEVNKKMNRILGVSDPTIESNDIIIPVLIENEFTGLYRITATMFINNVPSARLMQQVYLSQTGRQIVHIMMSNRLSRDRRIWGDSEIKDIILEKIPEFPGDIGGKSEPAMFPITIPYLPK